MIFLGKRKKGVVKLFENCDLTILGWFHEKTKHEIHSYCETSSMQLVTRGGGAADCKLIKYSFCSEFHFIITTNLHGIQVVMSQILRSQCSKFKVKNFIYKEITFLSLM